jgi:hypothetical protein
MSCVFLKGKRLLKFSYRANKNPRRNAGDSCFLSSERAASSEGLALFAVTVAAQKLVQSGRVRLKRKFLNISVAFRAFPIALIHLALKAALILVKCHFN